MAALSRRRIVVNSLRLFWVLVIVWYEYGTFSSSVRSCTWPDSTSTNESTAIDARPAHVLLIADPQIIDRNSYPNRNALTSYLTRLIVDLNLRKNWHAAVQTKPDVVVFLGDMMDNGRSDMSDAQYEAYYKRFKNIFKLDPAIPQYYIPGNHDVGLGKGISSSPNARERYVAHFGEPNHEIILANHSLILFDAPSYADEDAQRHGQKKSVKQWAPRRRGALEFASKFEKEQHTDPVILFSHIPLYRSDGRSCGPLREHGTIRPGVGPGYQNILEKHSSQYLLEVFKPVVIFSGDDHDYCEYTHQPIPPKVVNSVREVTVRTLSMVMNVRRPGFQLLSLLPSELRTEGLPTFHDAPCLLPDQLGIYINIYLPLLAISLLVVFFANTLGPRHTFHGKTSSEIDCGTPLRPNIEEPDQLESGLTPRYSSLPISISLPARLSSAENTLTSRNGRPAGWFALEDQRGDHETDYLSLYDWLNKLRETFCSYNIYRRFRRRTILTTTMLDIRDIAIFPVAFFVFIALRVVTR